MRISLAALTLAFAALTAQAETYTIDPRHSFTSFELDHLGLSMASGRFDKMSGTISYDPAAKTGSADVRIEVASVTSGDAERDAHLLKPEFFDAATHPAITFKSTAFRFEGEMLAAVEGDLAIRGVTKPVTLKVNRIVCKPHPLTKVPSCAANAEAKTKRSEFGVSAYLPGIGDDVTLHLAVEAQAKK